MGGFDFLRFLLAMALFIASFIRQYSTYTRIEYFLFLALLLADSSSSYCICVSVKVFVCLLFFMGDYLSKIASAKVDALLIIRYMIGSWKQPCHALIAFGDEVFHYTQDPGTGKSDQPHGVLDRAFYLDVRKHRTPFTTLRHKMFFSPCVGFAVPNISASVLQQRLEACGKCHDWAVTAVYVLSCHKFLSYSVVSFLRWLTWVGCVILATVMISLADYSPAETQSKHVALCDCILMSITLLDVINMIEFKLEDNDYKVRQVFYRDCYMQTVKLFMMCSFVLIIQKSSLHTIISRYGYFVYIGVCLFCSAIVHSITSSYLTRSSAHLDNPLSDHKKSLGSGSSVETLCV